MGVEWTQDEINILENMYKNGTPLKDIAQKLNRTVGSIQGKIAGLKLKEKYNRPHYKDATGKRFGKLTALKVIGRNDGSAVWLCQCDCGNLTTAPYGELSRGRKKSCGCGVIEARKKHNDYYVYDEIVFVKYTNCDEYFICDKEDWFNLKDYAWRKNDDGYVATNKGRKQLLFHRVVTNCPSNMNVDHIYQISRGVCDNRKSNLRICTQQENTRNNVVRKLNTSGVSGVSWDSINKKWYAYINVCGKLKNLGRYENFDDAVKTRLEAEKKYFGEFAPQSDMFEKYDINVNEECA